MKKFKRIVVSALAIIMLAGMMAVPASANTENDPHHYTYGGTVKDYIFNNVANQEERSFAVGINVSYSGRGVILPTISAEVNGEVFGDSITDYYRIYNTQTGPGDKSVSAGQTVTTDFDIFSCYCYYYAIGTCVDYYSH